MKTLRPALAVSNPRAIFPLVEYPVVSGKNILITQRTQAPQWPAGSQRKLSESRLHTSVQATHQQNEELQLVSLIESQCKTRPGFKNNIGFAYNSNVLSISESENTVFFNLKDLVIKGVVTEASIEVKDQLRRNGIRFKFEPVDGVWQHWKK